MSAGSSTKKYAEIYKASAASALSQWNAIDFGQTSFANGINTTSNTLQVQISGIYRVTYTIMVKNYNSTAAAANLKFFLAKGWSSSNVVPGSWGNLNLRNGESGTVTVTKLVQIDAYSAVQVYTDTTNANIKVEPNGTNFSIELVEAI